MSLFKKPNRNIRRREIEFQEDESDSKDEVCKPVTKVSSQPSKSTPKLVKQTLLSFGEEWNEGDDGEVFKVKKTSQSKKIRRIIEKEKEERRKKELSKDDSVNDKSKPKIDTNHIDEVTIKIKNPIAGPIVPTPRILSGLSAEMADYKSDSEDAEQETRPVRHKFTPPDQVRMMLKSGTIPDAALIHAARKRRQQAREMGTANYIPLEEETAKEEVDSKSRLIRDDDSDEEERITMAGILSYAADREKRKEGLDNVICSDVEDDDHRDEDEWETQQIRKAVSGAQLAAVQQESLYIQYLNNSNNSSSAAFQPQFKIQPYSSPSCDHMSNIFAQMTTESASDTLDPETIIKKLKERYKQVDEVNRRRDFDFRNMTDEIKSLHEEVNRRKSAVPDLMNRFEFYQDLRGYVTDLVECLDEKIQVISSLEQRVMSMYQKKANELISRRRLDVNDQMEYLTPIKNLTGLKRDEEQIRRAAEREGRRIRRVKSRTVSETASHIDGMSSDDEITEMAAATYRNQKGIIESDAARVFDDVVEMFSSIDEVLIRFSEWRKTDKSAYVEAYANLCLPKLLGPLIRTEMLMWNPLINPEDAKIENFKWIENVMVYSAHKTDTEESLRNDPDLQLVPRVIDKLVIPKLNQIVKTQWDPMSVTQTRRLLTVMKNILEYPFIAPDSKLFKELIESVIVKIDDAIENDVFIPLLPKQTFEAGKSNVFFQRQFSYAVKLLGNVLSWQGILNEELLMVKANTSILNRYLLMAIRLLPPLEAASKCYLVGKCLPKNWLKGQFCSIPSLSQFLLYCKQLITQIDGTNPHGKEAIEKLSEILKYIRS